MRYLGLDDDIRPGLAGKLKIMREFCGKLERDLRAGGGD
jgi:hypothetical protein